MKKQLKHWLVPILALILLGGWDWISRQWEDGSSPDATAEGVQQVMRAYEDRRSKVWVTVAGEVKRELADDNKGSRHQRFLLSLPNRHTLLVAHNIDLAKRVPLVEGDSLKIRGRYEWNQKGGVLHWTHHDPKGHIRGGWIEHKDKRYK